ncbi:MAG: selenoneine biosynthesis selenosugar synthase SenB [Burkholderiales bacterium]
MRIVVVTPAAASTRTGNRHTAARYAAFLRAGGHHVRVTIRWDESPCDLLIALHARRSLPSIELFKKKYPERPLIVVLTGTDVYRDIHTDANARRSLGHADRLIVLQERALDELTTIERAKAQVIYQSSGARLSHTPVARRFRIAVLGHIRDEKDPFCVAHALTFINAPNVEVIHVGDALSDDDRREALRWVHADSRYRWIGGRPHGNALRWLASSHVMVLSSKMEGGANVICEAGRIGVPVIASRVSGNIGMLGTNYPAYYPLGDAKALASMIERARCDARFYALMQRRIAERRALFVPSLEARGVLTAVRAAAMQARRGMSR